MSCQKCKSERILLVSSTVNNNFFMSMFIKGTNKIYNGYIPEGIGIGWQETLSFYYCLQCGQIQGLFPMPRTSLEKASDPPIIKKGMGITIFPKNIYKRKNRVQGIVTEAGINTVKVAINKSLDEKEFSLDNARCKLFEDSNYVEVFVNKIQTLDSESSENSEKQNKDYKDPGKTKVVKINPQLEPEIQLDTRLKKEF